MTVSLWRGRFVPPRPVECQRQGNRHEDGAHHLHHGARERLGPVWTTCRARAPPIHGEDVDGAFVWCLTGPRGRREGLPQGAVNQIVVR
jgi:hypothetical protein